MTAEIGFRARDNLGPRPDYGAGGEIDWPAHHTLMPLRWRLSKRAKRGAGGMVQSAAGFMLIHVSDMSVRATGYAQRLEEAEKNALSYAIIPGARMVTGRTAALSPVQAAVIEHLRLILARYSASASIKARTSPSSVSLRSPTSAPPLPDADRH